MSIKVSCLLLACPRFFRQVLERRRFTCFAGEFGIGEALPGQLHQDGGEAVGVVQRVVLVARLL